MLDTYPTELALGRAVGIPCIMFGAPLMLLLFYLLWSPPVGGQPLAEPYNLLIFAYFMIMIALFDLMYTFTTVAYQGLFPEMYEDLKERSGVSVYKQLFAPIGLSSAMALFPILREPQLGYLRVQA